jgi:dihydropteroate synthase
MKHADPAVSIIGILNVTPDSYVEHGKFATPDAAVAHAGAMLDEGADIIEIGGESTGPGSVDVSTEEELRRTIPMIHAIRQKYPDVVLSIDTYKAAVARAALEAGVAMVNDVTAGRYDQQMYSVVSASNAQIILMYAKDSTPRTTVEPRAYDDVVATIKSFLKERKEAAVAAGIKPEKIILDPGLGHFVSSDASYSFALLNRLDEFLDLGCPILVSPSRKSFLAGPENLPVDRRLPATLAATQTAVQKGASYIRTHDVLETRNLIGSLKFK